MVCVCELCLLKKTMPIQFDQSTSGTATLSAASSGSWSAALPTTYGSSTNVLGTDGTAFSWLSQPGLGGFTSGLSTTSPNATNNVAYLQPTSAGSIVFSPKGSGGISLRIPDSTATGGNARGAYSVDLSPTGAVATDVASGAYSVAVGNSVEASGDYSVAVGYGAKAKSNYSVSIGKATIPTGSNYAVAVSNSTASRSGNMSYSVSIGGNSLASGPYSTYLAGVGNGYDANTAASFVRPNAGPVLGPSDTNESVARVVEFVFGADTTDATPTVLYTDGTTQTGNGYLKILNNSTADITISIVCGVKTAGGNCGAFSYGGYATNNGGVITVSGAWGSVSGSSGFTPSATLTADNTNGAVTLTITGIASTSIRWCVQARMVMLTY